MRLYFFRHGETLQGAKGIILGSLPGELSSKGIEDTKKLGENLKNSSIPFSKIISSDLGRAFKTANILSEYLQIPVEIQPLLRERSGGVAEGKLESEIDWETYEKKLFPYRKHSGGESFYDVKKRVAEFMKFTHKSSDENVIIVTHSVFIKMFLAWALQIPMKQATKTGAPDEVPVFDTKKGTLEYMKLDS